MSLLPPGSRIGRFELSGVLGEGAMGVVYLAHDPQIERPVAIKTLRPHGGGASSTELESRFLKEAKLAGRLQHPNIVTIYEAGNADGVLYIAMEYVEGDSLNRFRDALSLKERTEVVREVALALQHAHRRGVLHRDVKPGNILLTRDRHVKVADFGIGKLLTATADLTRTGQMIGSPAYMSPEQVRGEKLDGRSDFFSLGVVFYELLTGARPFPGDSITTLVYQILHTEPRDPLDVRAELPPSAREVFARLLAKTPDKRPADADEFLAEVKRVADELGETEQTIAFSGASTPSGAHVQAAGTPPAAPARGVPPPAAPLAATVTATQIPAGGARRAPLSGAAYLFGIAAILVALAALIFVWRRSRADSDVAPPLASAGTPSAASSVARATPSEATPAAPGTAAAGLAASPSANAATPPATIGPLPTPGPASAADAVVGAPRYTGGTPPPPRSTRVPRPTPEPRVAAVVPPPATEPPPEPPRSADRVPDNTYRTRRYVKVGVSPDQARMYVDGRYVGIADDWDDRGGGRKFEFQRDGVHRLRFELPGYRDLNVEVLVTRGADDDTADVNDEVKRETRVAYPKIPSVNERTLGPVVFQVDPPDATISDGSRTLGPASSFGESSPLKLSGQAVHDLVISAPGHKSKTVRVLVGPSADNERARVKVELKKE